MRTRLLVISSISLISLLIFLPLSALCGEFKTLKLNESTIGKVYLAVGKTTVLSFPMRPSKVIVGNQGSFAVQYIENDVAISPTRPGVRSNLFVYVASRRFGFDLITTQIGDSVVLVLDRETESRKGK